MPLSLLRGYLVPVRVSLEAGNHQALYLVHPFEKIIAFSYIYFQVAKR
jgi:hypothetical protein